MNSMNRVNIDGRPISARDHHANDPDYIQWQKEYEAEQKAAQAADPEFQFKQAANAAAEANRHGVLTMPMNEAYLATFGTIVRPPFDESKVAYFMDRFKNEFDYVSSRGNARVLVEFIERNNLSPASLESFKLAHAILKLWRCYPDEFAPVVEEQPAQPVLSRSEQAIVDHQNYIERIVGTDEYGKSWTDEMIDRELNAKDGLRLRRLFEKGHRGSNLYDVYREIKDIQQQQEAERNRIAAEENR
jgi:hypothetical protein